jgi:hypothetical protein
MNTARGMFAAVIASVALVYLVLLCFPLFSAAMPVTADPNPPQLLFSQNRELYDHGSEILALQIFLNMHGFAVARSGPGSPAMETSYFGLRTYRALVKFQAANNLPATGYLGPLTRALIATFPTLNTPVGNSSASSGSAAQIENQGTSTQPVAASSTNSILPSSPVLFPVNGPGYGGGGGSSSGSSTPAPNAIPPSVSLTAPTASSTVSGSSVTLTATASGTVPVANVQFEVDGTNIGSASTSSPYTTTWNSAGVPDGSHTLYAVAEDASGNYATSSITVTVDNTPPTTSGSYSCLHYLYVSTTGNDANKGLSIAQAFATITHAASIAVAGDCVMVLPGTYQQQVTVSNGGDANTSTGYVAFVSQVQHAAKIIPLSTTYSTFVLGTGANYVIVDGFDIEGGGVGGGYGGGELVPVV